MTGNQNDNVQVHIWEKLDVTLTAQNAYTNPYTEVEVWVDLKGPDFDKRAYGFWDGGNVFRVCVLATAPGKWTWTSGSNQPDAGLNGKQGRFTAIEWTEAEKQENACRCGFLRPTANGHALEYADGMPCFLLGDTWWSTPTFRYPWYDDDQRRPIGPEMGFKDMVQFRKAQGYNCIAIIAALPQWANDGKPPRIWLDKKTGKIKEEVLNEKVRSAWIKDGFPVEKLLEKLKGEIGIRGAWQQPGTDSAKDMHNKGGRPFLFPGKVPGYEDVFPDVDRLNPAYFQHMDRKIDYLNTQGFIPFIEVARRDASYCWKNYYDWPESYARYIHYVFSRYQANNCILSPIHFDAPIMSIPSREYNEPANLVVDRYGRPPFGTLLSANASGSSLSNFDQARWITMHQIGNRRDHNVCWHLTEIYHECEPPRPALNGEPYYAGWPPNLAASGGSEEDDLYCRAAMYGSFLSGGFAGHIYGADGLWAGDIEPEALNKMWESIRWKSGAQMQHLRTFALSEGCHYQHLVPNADLVYPNRTHDVHANRGWAFCARTPEKDVFMLYFEADCLQATVRGAKADQTYRAQWFDPRNGEWIDADQLTSNAECHISLPPFPSSKDWGLKLVLGE